MNQKGKIKLIPALYILQAGKDVIVAGLLNHAKGLPTVRMFTRQLGSLTVCFSYVIETIFPK